MVRVVGERPHEVVPVQETRKGVPGTKTANKGTMNSRQVSPSVTIIHFNQHETFVYRVEAPVIISCTTCGTGQAS